MSNYVPDINLLLAVVYLKTLSPFSCFPKCQLIINVTLLPVNCIEPKKIATDFHKDLRRIKTKFLRAGSPVIFINDTFFRFNEEKEELLIPNWLFDETKLLVIRLPMAKSNLTLFGIPEDKVPFQE